ncbi:hypothetical protein FRC20_009054 [Serendipita sp. 405]|nr:hypothetical protein FRC20_009054 [Serendipita sp. 405]
MCGRSLLTYAFFSVAIGKRTRTRRKMAWSSSIFTRRGHRTIVELGQHGGHPASTDVGRRLYEVDLFPESDDLVRISRFRVLVDVFHGGYQDAICDKNLSSRSNTVLIDRRWLSMFDNGAFHLRVDGEQVYAVPLWDEATAIIPPCHPISHKTTSRAHTNSVIGGSIRPDAELVSLHALILRTWHGTGTSQKSCSRFCLKD